uniref:Protein RER1 n=1 Tax=Metchnikovella dogieli TaxID=2804710 RepID=A0A896WNR1_9MICR|nr:retrieval of early ER protein Rer1 [Metchnikovella dogieli]
MHGQMIPQKYLDKITPMIYERWSAFFVLLFFFMYLILKLQSHYVVCYALWIYLLNGFILFLSPFSDPDEEGDSSLPKTQDEEFRPFIRKLPELAFWKGSTIAVLVSLATLLFSFFDIPVFWPVLVIYFCVLTFLMLRKQIEHMIRHKYIPLTMGKVRYKEGEIRL